MWSRRADEIWWRLMTHCRLSLSRKQIATESWNLSGFWNALLVDASTSEETNIKTCGACGEVFRLVRLERCGYSREDKISNFSCVFLYKMIWFFYSTRLYPWIHQNRWVHHLCRCKGETSTSFLFPPPSAIISYLPYRNRIAIVSQAESSMRKAIEQNQTLGRLQIHSST